MANHRTKGGRLSTRKRLLLLIAVILLALLVIGVGAWVVGQIADSQVSAPSNTDVPTVEEVAEILEYEGNTYEKRSGLESFLVIGLDKFEGEVAADSYTNDQQADFLMLFVIDNESKTYTTLNINRDTMAYMSVLGLAGEEVGTVYQQLTLAHTYGKGGKVSCRNTVDAVEGVLKDIVIDHYASVTMDAVAELNDLVGGVEVTIEDDFSGIDGSLVMGETVTLKGEQALTFVRSRKGMDDSSNNARMNRQITYVKALAEKASQHIENDETFMIELAELIDKYFVSDCSVTRLQSLFEKISSYEFADSCMLEGESVKGERYMEFYPSEKSINDVIVKLFYKPQEQ